MASPTKEIKKALPQPNSDFCQLLETLPADELGRAERLDHNGELYDPEAILAFIYTSGTTSRPKGVKVTHANILANVDHFNYWMGYREGGVYLHAAPIFHIADFPAMFAAPAFGASQFTIPEFSPQGFCELVERERVTHTVLVPTMLNLLTQMPEGKLCRRGH